MTNGGDSPQGRRILLAIVTGDAGRMIQAFREQHDPAQARRYPPHATLCYWVPADVDFPDLDRQVRHAFAAPVAVRLGPTRRFDNETRTLYVSLAETDALDAARARLYDGRFASLGAWEAWDWHVSCLRDTRALAPGRVAELASSLSLSRAWAVTDLRLLELVGHRYETRHQWRSPEGSVSSARVD